MTIWKHVIMIKVSDYSNFIDSDNGHICEDNTLKKNIFNSKKKY